MTDDEQVRRYQKHFEVLADALAAPGSSEQARRIEELSASIPRTSTGPEPESPADPIMPLHAPEWLWSAMERYLEAAEALELVWSGIERTFVEIRELPDTAPGECPASEEYVWTREDIDRDRDFEAAGWDSEEEED